MGERLASLRFCQAFFNLARKPLVVIQQAFYRLKNQRRPITTLLTGKF